MSSKSSEEKSHEEINSVGNLHVKNQGIIKGDVNLVGSNLVLGDNSFVAGKVTTDSRELNSTYSYKESKKGFSSSIGSSGFSIGYGKTESKLKEKDLTNAKSNLVLGDNVTLNKGADITATNLIHGQVSINNGDIKFGAKKDTKDVETSTNSSGLNLSVKIKSEAVDRAKQGVDSFKQMKSGDILGGIASTTNTVTGVVSGLASNQGTKLPTSAVNADNTVGKDNLKAAQATNNFYADAGVNFGYTKSSSKTNSHSESAVVTTIRGKDENSSITYNNVKNIEYVGTQAQDTKFIYNNVENINKRAVELKNSYSSSSTSSGISTGVTIGYGDGTQTSVDAVKVSASQSKMNSNGTTYQNGRFVNVDEVHNNTKNMTLSGFNQEGGKVTGNIENLTIESKQNTSTIKGRTIGGSLSIAPNGMPSGSANYSQTNGERRVVDNASTFIIGDGSNLKVGKVENTAAAIGTSENGKLSIDEYVGYNLENVDKLKTAGGSVGVSTSGITSIGVNYSDKKQEGITKNTVIGNVEIGKSSGDAINKDLDTMTETTEDRDFKTNVNVESQTINYIKNPEKFKEDLQKAKNEVEDLGDAVKNTSNPLGKDKRNIFSNLRAQRWSTSFYNVIGSRVEELARQFKAREINEEDLKEALRDIVKGYGKDIGIDFDVVYLDESTMPKDSKGSTGSSYIVDRKNRKVLIPIDVNKIEDIKKVLGTLTEEVAHGKDALEGRQDKKVAEDKSNDEEGLESLGRPANEYVKKKFGEDNNSKIKLTTDGIDLSNADVGEKVGDVTTSEDRAFRTGYQSKYKYIQMDFYRVINGAVGLTGSVFRGGASYGLMDIGYSLMLAPEPSATKALGVGFMLGGLIAGAFTASDAVESGQDVYYGVTNQRDKKSVNFGRELLGEDIYDPLNTLSVAGMPILYDQANYTKVMVEGEAAKRAIIYNPNLTYDENKYLNDYMGKEMPGKVTSKYGDVKTYRYADVVDNNKNTSVSKTPVINKSGASQGINNTTKIASQNPNTSMANQNQISNVTVGTISKGATSNKQQGAPVSKTSDTNKSGINQGVTNATQKAISANTKQNVNPLIISDGTLNNGTKYVVIESSSEKIKSVDELLTKEGQAKIGNSSIEELQNLFEEAGYKTERTNANGTGGGEKLIIQGHKTEDGQSIGSIRSNTSAGTHKSNYKIISGNFKNENGENIGGKIKIVEGSPDSYNTRGNTPEKAELIFIEKKEENK